MFRSLVVATFLAVSVMANPPSITVTNSIDGDDVFNVTTGTPGSCSCETPSCNIDGSTGTRLFLGDSMKFKSDNCAYYNIGGGLADSTGNPCAMWRADNAACTVSPGGVVGDCSRLSVLSCALAVSSDVEGGTTVTLTAEIDRDCDVLPYATCTPGTSTCCGDENECALAEPSTTYYMCQPTAARIAR